MLGMADCGVTLSGYRIKRCVHVARHGAVRRKPEGRRRSVRPPAIDRLKEELNELDTEHVYHQATQRVPRQ
jgi:hypothetical protein